MRRPAYLDLTDLVSLSILHLLKVVLGVLRLLPSC